MLAFLLLNAGAGLTAAFVAHAAGGRVRASLFTLCTLGAFLVLVHSAVLATGLVGWLTVGGLAVFVGLALVVAATLGRRPAPIGGRGDDEPPPLTPATAFVPLLAIVCGLAAAWPHLGDGTRLWVWDDYTYHMVYPTRWLREHAIAAVTPAHAFTTQAWYPLSASVVSTWFMAPFAASRADALAWVSLTGVLYAGLVAGAMVELLARLGSRRGAWGLPVLLFATSLRVETMASAFSDADLAQAAALFAALVFAVPRREVEHRAEIVADAAFAALLSGLAIGVKVSAAPVAIVVLAMIVWRARAEEARSRVLGIFALAWLATGAYWYVRNLVHTGNPLYPVRFLFWPGTTLTETTLREYSQRYGLVRTVTDALVVYLNWPLFHAVLAIVGLAAIAAWVMLRRGSMTRPQRYFAGSALIVTALVLAVLPVTPYSAGNGLTFAAGLIHWDSMRYVALLPLIGWAGLGALVDAGAGAPRARPLVAAMVMAGALLAASDSTWWSLGLLVVAVVLATVVGLAPHSFAGARVAFATGALMIAGVTAIIVGGHGSKARATAEVIRGEPLFGPATAVLDRQPPGTRVAVFGDQWIYPTYGARHDLDPVRLDGNGRIATAPIGAAFTPEPMTVHPWTLGANLAAARVGIVVVFHAPHPGRSPDWPNQAAALDAMNGARLLFRNRVVGVWKIDE